jgi:hypothetical protein
VRVSCFSTRAAFEEQFDDEGRLWTQNRQRMRAVLAES